MRNDGFMPESLVTSGVARVRMAVGLLQGMVLYFLYHAAKTNAWPASADLLFSPLLMVSLLAPVILISSLGHLDRKQAAIWLGAVVVVIGLLALHDVWRGGASQGWVWGRRGNGTHPHYPSARLIVFSIAGLYIAHALVLAGVADRRRIAGYPTYFEAAWKLLIQIKFSALFVGALWLVLWLGAALFMLVKLNFLRELLRQSWFVIPVTAFAFSCAMHITDVRPAIVRGIRALLLVLLSWILPITTLLVVGFLLSLPWTGLAPLWATRHATGVLLGAAAVLVVLVNAAFQNGEVASGVARIVRVCARVAALALLPLAAIAIYSLGLRVAEYGWTTDRIIAAACLLIASVYATGYAWAAARSSPWLGPVAQVNVANAFVILAVLLAMFSPIADPARLSVNNQIARLAAGKISVDKFDFDYLRFEGARYGMAALEQLKTRAQGSDAALIRQKAELSLKKKSRWQQEEPPLPRADLVANLAVWPKAAQLPPSFLQEDWKSNKFNWQLPKCLKHENQTCDAYLIDFSGDGKPELLAVGTQAHGGAVLLMEDKDGHWAIAGVLPNDFAGCEPLRQKLQAGSFQLLAPRIPDLDIAGQRIEINNGMTSNSVSCAGHKRERERK
ncbi:DUF4153 domain-containing protein [Noviherbaspirillum sedimenti]|uniref:DUF4153 domain-containing protein n=2 Tax=Noviherbaspirillum sedimenti TaxID=2320865 RepID=A0A3A3G1S0_9BURK|nr:DUF4153 domain-containing protein [Noviherbaspirillum sedimenti]